jgi:hypothetical protein
VVRQSRLVDHPPGSPAPMRAVISTGAGLFLTCSKAVICPFYRLEQVVTIGDPVDVISTTERWW